MLPEKWAIERNKNNYKTLNEYFGKLYKRRYASNGNYMTDGDFHNGDYMLFPKCNNKATKHFVPEGYTLISFEIFKQFVLNKPVLEYEIY